ncbi:Glyoxalase/bleomycin resistance protein/dioxygenase [Devosia sp. LC5]|uniref:VOC family protein n=1 Tax=Devosia sp. LC5 TaxID=1502724 RepID=UPI0004E2E2D3|nr:VOC family protein [Devosia sp. LC5]KFC61320.1 Glyoxalase/bleomycin resistance protein/dioxygenase [Devosia sp. LC5]
MAKLVHSMIRVIDEARSIDFYRRAFRLELAERIAFDDFALVYLRHPTEDDFELELTVNFGRTEPYELGNGYGHLAVVVDELDAEHARFTAEGFNPRPLKDFMNKEVLVARFFFVADPDGYQIEVIQKGGRFGKATPPSSSPGSSG